MERVKGTEKGRGKRTVRTDFFFWEEGDVCVDRGRGWEWFFGGEVEVILKTSWPKKEKSENEQARFQSWRRWGWDGGKRGWDRWRT